MDPESTEWVRDLRSEGPSRDRAIGRLHELLLRVARAEAGRRRARVSERVLPELDDLCVESASDAVLAVTRKLDTFRGAAKFTTWACKFVILEFSTRLRRRVWRDRALDSDETIWDRLADATPTALQEIEHGELFEALRLAIQEDLSERQRFVFQAVVIHETPIDVVAERLSSSRGAVYKALHDARRRLRHTLAAKGYLEGTVT